MMFSLGKVLGLGAKKAKAKPAARPRARLGCEQMEDRTTPAWVTFNLTMNDGMTAYGIAEFDDQTGFNHPERHLEIFDFVMYINNEADQYIQLYQVGGYVQIDWTEQTFNNPTLLAFNFWAETQEGALDNPDEGEYREVSVDNELAHFYDWQWNDVWGSVTYSQLYFGTPPPGW